MGDRRMAELRTSHGSIYLYTHWGGYSLPKRAKEAMEAAKPWLRDEPYYTRILIDQLTKENRDMETGAGISLKPEFEDEYNSDKPSVIINTVDGTLVVLGRS